MSACTLELAKLAYYKQLQYAPSRNRQWHLYTATERPDAKRCAFEGGGFAGGEPALLHD